MLGLKRGLPIGQKSGLLCGAAWVRSGSGKTTISMHGTLELAWVGRFSPYLMMRQDLKVLSPFPNGASVEI